jgi:hypothetical protein
MKGLEWDYCRDLRKEVRSDRVGISTVRILEPPKGPPKI